MASRFASFWKSRLTLSKFLQLKWNHALFWFLPFALSRCWLVGLGRLYYQLNRQEHALIRATIQRVFRGKIAAEKLRGQIRDTFTGIFDHYHEKLFVGYSKFPKLIKFLKSRIGFQGRERLEEALADGLGVILVTGHFGALELLPGALAVNAFPTSMICRFQNTRLREAQGHRAQWVGLDLIEPGRGQGFHKAMQALKAGRILIIECDEFERWRPDCQREIRFLGHRLALDQTLEMLHRRSGAPVITALMQRDGQGRYTCELTPVSESSAPVNIPVAERCLAILEAAVQAHPEQWYQWKEFGKMVKTHREVGYDHPEGGYLAPEPAISLPDQA
jgi:lauroyl/myristoyl acyltransferase